MMRCANCGRELLVGLDGSLCSMCVPDYAPESVNHPPHYGGADNLYEAIKVIEAWELGFCLGNAVKYICRAGKKSSELEDLKKARWYLDREIQRLEQE